MSRSHRAQRTLLMVAVVLVSLNLRPAIAAIGPLTTMILNDTYLGSTGIGLLTMVPIFLMGVGSLSVRAMRSIFDETFGIALGSFIIATACGARVWLDTGLGLIATAAGAGIGISIVQALAPGFIKRNFGADTARGIGLFSTGIVAGAAMAAASAAGLANTFGWSIALASWGIPALLAMAFWFLTTRPATSEKRSHSAVQKALRNNVPIFRRSARSWSLLVFFGIGTGAFMLVMAWLPPFYVELGQSRQVAGYLLAGLTFVEALTALGLAAVIHHFPDRRGPLVTCLILVLGGLTCLLVHPLSFAIPAILLLGAGIGILFPLSIIIAIDHADDPTMAGDFTAFVQGGGYIVASFVPLIAGALRDAFADLSQAWMLMAIGIVALIPMALRYSPDSYLIFRQGVALGQA